MAGPLVVGIGGDGAGTAAARTAARVATMMNVPVVLVFGFEASPLGPRGGPLEEQILDVGRIATTAVRDELIATHPTLQVDVELVQQRPVDALLAVAEARGAEVLAVGHGGSGPLRGALLGSITYEVVHRAPLPVLVVPEPEVTDA
jgi:nucleotide-binding universal stress UspA family protein